jgi:hypothetical protein
MSFNTGELLLSTPLPLTYTIIKDYLLSYNKDSCRTYGDFFVLVGFALSSGLLLLADALDGH